MPIGVLALQGGYQVHADALVKLGETVIFVRTPAQLQGCEGLVIPGGESSTMLILMAQDDAWFAALRQFAQQHWLFGTCAGMILLAKHVQPQQPSLGLIDINVQRNAYGRQKDSRITLLPYINQHNDQITTEIVFIRAPKISSIEQHVSVLLEEEGVPILVQQCAVMAASFHPESAQNLGLYQDCLCRLRNAIHPS